MNKHGKIDVIIRNIEPELHRALRMQALRERISMQALVIKAIAEYLEGRAKK